MNQEMMSLPFALLMARIHHHSSGHLGFNQVLTTLAEEMMTDKAHDNIFPEGRDGMNVLVTVEQQKNRFLALFSELIKQHDLIDAGIRTIKKVSDPKVFGGAKGKENNTKQFVHQSPEDMKADTANWVKRIKIELKNAPFTPVKEAEKMWYLTPQVM